MAKKNSFEITQVWKRYEKGVEHHRLCDLYDQSAKNYRFYEGDQWAGVQAGGEELPIYNVIQPIVKYKVASVSMNNMDIVYTPMAGVRDRERAEHLCGELNHYAAKQWERLKMYSLMWELNKASHIAGDAYLYFYDETGAQLIDNTNIYLSDEQNPDLQEQKYILISERRFVSDVKKEARENGVPQDQIDLVVEDDDTEDQIGLEHTQEVDADEGKCTSILMLEKREDGVWFSRSTRNVVYEPAQNTTLSRYPLVSLICEGKKGSSRGIGAVKTLIPNQIAINKTLFRRDMAVKLSAFPRLAYDASRIENIEDLDKAGVKIAVRGQGASAIHDMVSYLNPAPISGDARILSEELMTRTKELAGAGDAALGQVDPEQASGTAIQAVRDQAAIPLNEQVARYRQAVEDVARVWFDMWATYHPDGLLIEYEQDGMIQSELLPGEELRELEVDVRIDVSPSNPISRYSQELELRNLFQMGAITLEELTEMLDESSALPKNKLRQVLSERKRAEMQALAAPQGLPPMTGGMQDEMPML